MTRFLCISGKAQNGKDTTAAMFYEELTKRGYRVLLTHYADLLKYICRSLFGWDGEKDEAGRTLLQRVGTDCIRRQKPSYWVDFLTGIVRMFPDEWDFVIVADVRFPNELTGIKGAGFPMTHIRVTRANFVSPLTAEQQAHPSETALDHTLADWEILNRTLEELREKVNFICDAEGFV